MDLEKIIIKDQAESLRHQIETTVKKKSIRSHSTVTKVISFTSGKGGVGKTTSVVNTALSLGQLGRKVLIFDADLGLANVDVMLGRSAKYTLHDVINGTKTINDIILEGPNGIDVIPSSSGVEKMCSLSVYDKQRLLESVSEASLHYDYLLIDTQAGIGNDVMFFNAASSEIVCIVTPDPTSITDAYALIKILVKRYKEKCISIVTNNVPSINDGLKLFSRLEKVVDRFLAVKLNHIGTIRADEQLLNSVRTQIPVALQYPTSEAARGYMHIAEKLEARYFENRIKGGVQFLFQKILEQENWK
jgi:flagellar biosynthesis protein FlhG